MPYRYKPVERTVFRAYDIRGIINQHFNEDAFFTIGRAVATRLHSLNRQAIYLARDGRLSSGKLAAALQAGLIASGAQVIDLGEIATPVMYYATHATEVDCGVIVTGSHNPAEYNGIKIVLAGKTLVQADIDILYNIIEQNQFYDAQGTYQTNSIIDKYKQRIIGDIKLRRALKVVVDCGNGVAGTVIPEVLKNLGCEVIPLYCEVDGRFPNHHPDPTIEENLIDLRQTIFAAKADIGVAFDGDADRLVALTEKGDIIWPDRLMMLFAQHLLPQQPGATIVFDVKCSTNLASLIKQSGGIAKMCPTGHSIVKGIMRESEAILAGEMSGHIFFKDRWYGFDDGLFAACRLLEIISQSNLSVSEQFKAIPNSVNTPEIKIPISENKKFIFIQEFIEKAEFSEAKCIYIDGLRVEFKEGWGLLRASNTTPCLIARFEAANERSLEHIKYLFKKQLNRLDKDLELPF